MFSSENLQENLLREDKKLRAKRCGDFRILDDSAMTSAMLIVYSDIEPDPRTTWPRPCSWH